MNTFRVRLWKTAFDETLTADEMVVAVDHEQAIVLLCQRLRLSEIDWVQVDEQGSSLSGSSVQFGDVAVSSTGYLTYYLSCSLDAS